MKNIFLIVCSVFVFVSSLEAQPGKKISRHEYIQMYKDVAIEKMNEFGIPASITLAQGILESNSGNSALAVKANNHFGIKCHKGWTGGTIRYDDDEANECFRKYTSAGESYRDHSLFLTLRPRYAFLFSYDVRDYKSWAHGLKKAGYATNPQYAYLLIKIIEENQLYLYDQGKNPVKPPVIINNHSGLFASGYVFPSPDEFSQVRTLESGRKVYKNNRVEFIFIEAGDTFLKLSMELGIKVGKLYKYNDLANSDKLYVGQMFYLKKKKRRSKIKYHTVEEFDTPYSIAMRYGIRLKSLRWKNRMKKGDTIRTGDRLNLRRRKPSK